SRGRQAFLTPPLRFQGPRVEAALRPPGACSARGALAHGATLLRINVSRTPSNPSPGSAELHLLQRSGQFPSPQGRGLAPPCLMNRQNRKKPPLPPGRGQSPGFPRKRLPRRSRGSAEGGAHSRKIPLPF